MSLSNKKKFKLNFNKKRQTLFIITNKTEFDLEVSDQKIKISNLAHLHKM